MEYMHSLLTNEKILYTITAVVVIQVTTEWIAPYLQARKKGKGKQSGGKK